MKGNGHKSSLMNLGWFLLPLSHSPDSREAGGNGELAWPVDASRHSAHPRPVTAGLTASQLFLLLASPWGGLLMRKVCPAQLDCGEV